MNRDRLERIQEIHVRALEVDATERPHLLAKMCAGDEALRTEIESLLAARDRMHGFLEQAAPERFRRVMHPPLRPGATIGGYEVVRKLEAGGGGTVYEAIQLSPRRHVALKVLDADVAGVEHRFHEEAELLARLQHPGVATVFEAGVHETDGFSLPWFAMEYVHDARPITAFAQEERLERRARVALAARVCNAVHHGHQKGVVHRDVKPGNVLVNGEGQPKVIDFGVARTVGPERVEDAAIVGTLAYMSPEQCEPGVEIDVRSDVYSLGVLIYELLTGRLPHEVAELSITEAARRIRDERPVPIEEHDRTLRGDIAAIVPRALHRDREQRYASAAALGDDLRRHLEHRPVEARPAGLLYQVRKFARRQRLAFLSLSAVVVVSVAAALLSGWMALEKERQRQETEFQSYVTSIAAATSALRVNDVADARQHLERAATGLRGWEWRHLWSRLDASLRTMDWPGRNVFCGAVDPSGHRVAAIGVGPVFEVGLWDVRTGERMGSFALPRVWPNTIAFHPDGQLLAVGYDDGKFELRDASSGAIRLEFLGNEASLIDCVFHPSGDVLASAGADGLIILWDAQTGERIGTLRGHTDRVISICFSRDGSRLASGGREGTVRIWNPESGEALSVLHGHEGSVEAVAFDPSGERLVSGSRDRTVRVWSLAEGRETAVGRGHSDNVRDVAYSDDGQVIVSASYDRTLRLWDGRDASLRAVLRGHTDAVRDVDVVPGSGRFVSFSTDGTVKVWDLATDADVPTLRGHDDAVTAIAWSASGQRLASGSRDGAVRVWDLPAGKTTRVLRAHNAAVDGLAFEERDLLLATSLTEGRVRSFRLDAGAQRDEGPGLVQVFDPRSRRRYVGTQSGRILVRGPRVPGAREDPVEWSGHDTAITALAIDAQGMRLASGSADGVVRMWNTADRTNFAEARPRKRSVQSVAVSPDGQLVAVAHADGAVQLLDGRSLATLQSLEAHTARVTAVTFSPDGARIATASLDKTVRLWDVARRRQVAVLHHPLAVLAVAFSPDGGRLASGDGQREIAGAVRIWEAPAAATNHR